MFDQRAWNFAMTMLLTLAVVGGCAIMVGGYYGAKIIAERLEWVTP